MNSRDYWAQREEEALKHYIKDEKEYDRQIERIYRDMLDSVQEQINGFYGRYADKEGITLAEAKKRVKQADIAAYERKAARYVKDKDFSKQANEEMRLYNLTMKVNRLEMLKANIGLELIAGHDELDKFMGDILRGRTMDELQRQAGILGKTVRNNARTAHAIVNGSYRVASVGGKSTFSDYIWLYQDQMRENLGRLLQTGLIQGKNPRAITKDLKKYWYGKDPKTNGGAVYCMERLMRTELARVQTDAQKQSFERNGYDKYILIPNIGCCAHCTDAANKDTGYSEKGVYLVKDMMPGSNAAPMHPHCRCSTAAWEDSDEYNAWLDFLSKGGTTEEWEKLKGENVAPQTAQSKFTPAKTVEEAEAFAKQFVDESGFGSVGLSYNGVCLEVANDVNRALFNVYNLFNIPKLGGIAAPAKNTKLGKMVTAHAAYSPIRKSLLMDRNKTRKASVMLEGLMEDKKAITSILTHPERYDFSKIGTRLRKIIDASSTTGRSIVAEDITETITHEMGHHIEKTVSNEDWEIIKAGMEQYAAKVSGYAADSPSEYFAESFASYMKGENYIDPALRKIFDKMRK